MQTIKILIEKISLHVTNCEIVQRVEEKKVEKLKNRRSRFLF